MTDFSSKSDKQIATWVRNYEKEQKTNDSFYKELLLERARRAQASQKLDFEKSIEHLTTAAIEQRCTTYGDLAAASGVAWSQARHQMNGAHGHLDHLLEICHARGLPLLPALCVNQQNLAAGELGNDALAGFTLGAQRLGLSVNDGREFHHACRDACRSWGRELQQARG